MIRRLVSVLMVLVMVVSATAPAVAAGQQASGEGYAGTHVSFETSENAIVDYQVGGATVLESVETESQAAVESGGSVGVDVELSGLSEFVGAMLSLNVQTDVRASLSTDSGAELTAHDTPRGTLVVEAESESQYVAVDVASEAEVESEGDDRVVVTREDGSQGAFVVVGDGEVTVDNSGNVTADVPEDARLVFRSYEDGRDADDEEQERLIADGTAAAEVYVTESGEQGSELAADVVQYADDTTVEVTNYGQGTVEMTANRTESEGRVIVTTVSEQAIESADDVTVTVDGEAAAEASSYSDLEAGIADGEPRYLVRNDAAAEGTVDVAVAVDHFSTRDVTIASQDSTEDDSTTEESTDDSTETEDGTTDSGSGDDSDGETQTAGEGPGFGVALALAALVLAGLGAARRS